MSHYFTNNKIKSNLKNFKIKILNEEFIFNTDNGIFSKRSLDFGSKLLINNLLKENIRGDVLEIGCGYGIIGIVLSRFCDINIDMVDVNKRAIHLSEMNIKLNKSSKINVFYSESYSNVNKRYDYIITNPPIRAGKKIVYEILLGAKNYLNDNGTLYFVMRKEQGALSTIKYLEKVSNLSIIERNKGYFIIRCNFR